MHDTTRIRIQLQYSMVWITLDGVHIRYLTGGSFPSKRSALPIEICTISCCSNCRCYQPFWVDGVIVIIYRHVYSVPALPKHQTTLKIEGNVSRWHLDKSCLSAKPPILTLRINSSTHNMAMRISATHGSAISRKVPDHDKT